MLATLSSQVSVAKVSGPLVKIGALLPLTGYAAEWGQQQKVALEIIKEKLNSAGGIDGIPIDFIVYDTRTKPEEAINGAKRLATSDNVLVIQGPTMSSECEVVFPVLNRLMITAISPTSSKPGVSAENRPWPFRNSLSAFAKLTPTLAKWKKIHTINTAVIVYDNKDALSKAEGTEVAPVLLKKQAINVLTSITFLAGDIDFRGQITKIKSLNADGIFISGQYNEVANFIRQARDMGLKQSFVTSSQAATPQLITLGGAAIEGTMTVTEAWTDNPDPQAQEFVKEFMRRYGKAPNSGAFRIYDNVYITKMIIEKSAVENKPETLQVDRQKIRDGWAALNNYAGISGMTSMNKEGDAEGEIIILQIKGGKFEKVE